MGLFNVFKNKDQNSTKKDLAQEEQKDYIKETDEYTLKINNDIMSDETLQYATNIVEKFLSEKDKILDYFLDIELRTYYKTNFNYSDNYIKENLGKPYITIDFKNEGNPNWKFQYAGIIDFVDNTLDDHIISIEFTDDLKFDDNIQFNG